ncbi:MAG: hypothetical protein M0R21_03175 [Lentimicrobiaceae bacterium]|nr:hypothetical protein [Lentimicrobiaceae bacterium]
MGTDRRNTYADPEKIYPDRLFVHSDIENTCPDRWHHLLRPCKSLSGQAIRRIAILKGRVRIGSLVYPDLDGACSNPKITYPDGSTAYQNRDIVGLD